MSTAEVEVWLERISVVGRKSRTDGFLDVLQWYSELQNFLCAWKNKFSTEVRPVSGFDACGFDANLQELVVIVWKSDETA